MELIIILAITVFVLLYRMNPGGNVYSFITKSTSKTYDKFAPYSFKMVREKVKELGQEYSIKDYTIQVVVIAGFAAVIAYLYFYSIIWAVIYAVVAVSFIPYLAYMRCQRVYSEYIFEQIQTYCTNVIMEFNVTQSFVKALEGVCDSGVLENPVLQDVKIMIDMAYQNGTVDASIAYFNGKYPYYMVKNMHQLFLQITKEGARDAGQSLENMSQDIDTLVEGVYRDQMDRKNFHGRFIKFGVSLFFLILAVQYMLQIDAYLKLIQMWYVQIFLHIIIIVNARFLLKGEKYYNADVGVE
jgi:hypothetical protein